MSAYLQIPGVQGEETGAYFGWIELLSVQWPVASNNQTQSKEIVITKLQDSTSNALLGLSLNGPAKDMTISFSKDGQEYMKYELKGVLIASYSIGGVRPGNDRPTETMTLNFESISMSYTKKDDAATGYDSKKDDYSYDVCYPDYGSSSLE
jgi:type VI protein secretion system component Hcp